MKYLTANKNRPIEQQLDSVDEYRWPDGLKLAMLMAFVLTVAGSVVFLGCYLAWVKMYGV
jgi:CRISPR/Cas system CMR-associated protein Cmr3 (group 5 of RAMP superfamily)